MIEKFVKLIPNLEPLLRYGIRGGVVALAIITYRLLYELGIADKLSTSSIWGVIAVFSLCIIGAGFGEFLDYKRSIVPKIGKTIGAIPEESFLRGGDAKKLAGRWKVLWYAQDSPEKQSGYLAKNPDQEPEPEKHYMVIDGSQIHSIADDPTTRVPYYWAFGRASSKDCVTLMYWSDCQSNVRILVGTLFLKIVEEINEPIRMEGWWTGYTRDEKVNHGTVVWKKES
jgi:hypothetical protein